MKFTITYVEVVLMKRMKDIIPISNHHFWKPAYLNRLVSVEMRRRERFKALYQSGKGYFEADKITRRGIK